MFARPRRIDEGGTWKLKLIRYAHRVLERTKGHVEMQQPWKGGFRASVHHDSRVGYDSSAAVRCSVRGTNENACCWGSGTENGQMAGLPCNAGCSVVYAHGVRYVVYGMHMHVI